MKKHSITKDTLTKKIKEITSHRGRKKIIQCLESLIKDRRVRKETIPIVRALHGKKIRNTSGI